MTDLADQMFPPAPKKWATEFDDFNYWRDQTWIPVTSQRCLGHVCYKSSQSLTQIQPTIKYRTYRYSYWEEESLAKSLGAIGRVGRSGHHVGGGMSVEERRASPSGEKGS